MSAQAALLASDRFFDPYPGQRCIARELYDAIARLPIVCPHGHVDPRLLADDNATFGTPTDLFIIPDHYVFRMLYSQNDDTRAFASIPARHDIWRRASANWLAGMVVRGLIDEAEAAEMAPDMANGLARLQALMLKCQVLEYPVSSAGVSSVKCCTT